MSVAKSPQVGLRYEFSMIALPAFGGESAMRWNSLVALVMLTRESLPLMRKATRKNVAAGDHVAAHPLARFGRLGRLQWTTAARWDASLPSAEAAKRASRAISVWNAPSNLPLLCQTSW